MSTRPFLSSVQRRQDYAKEISNNVKRLDSTKFNFKYHNFLHADHNNIVVQGLQIALEFINRIVLIQNSMVQRLFHQQLGISKKRQLAYME